MDFDVAIVGGGITGLTAAHYLNKAGYKVALFERGPEVGGVVKSERIGEFLIERAANSTMEKPALTALLQSLQIEDSLLRPESAAKNRFIVMQSASGEAKMQAVPISLGSLIGSPLLSILGKLRVLMEPLVAKKPTTDTSVFDFVSEHFGTEVATNIVAPALNGIWAADISKLSCKTALPRLWTLAAENRSIILGGLKSAFKKNKAPRAKLVSFQNGMQSLADEIVVQLPADCIFRQTSVDHVALNGNHASIVARRLNSPVAKPHTLSARSLIIATEGNGAAVVLRRLCPEIADYITSVPSAPLGVIHFAIDKSAVEHSLDGFGALVRAECDTPLLGAIFNSSLFPNRAPSDQHLITAFVGGATRAESSNVNSVVVQQEVSEFLGKLIGARRLPKVIQTTYWENAISNYAIGHEDLQKQVAALVSDNPQLQIGGGWLSGISFVDRIANGQEMAEKISADLNSHETRTVVNA